MASSDALPISRKNTAYRVTFGIQKSDGTLITGATGLDSEISKDAGAFADCTNEATEISQGVYILDLTNTEMNADCVAIVVKSTSVGAITPLIVMYPMEDVDIRSNVVDWSGTAVASPDTAGYPKTTVKVGMGTGELDITSGVVKANLVQILATALTETSGQIAAAFKKFFDIVSPTSTINLITTVTNLTNAPTSGDFTAVMKTSLSAATPSVTVSDKTGFSLSSVGIQAIWDALTSNLTTVGSIGKRIVDFVTTLVYASAPDSAAIASATQTGLTNQGFTTTRAGYQDNLNVGGHVSSSAEVTAIQNNTNVVRVVPSVFERPDSGSTVFRVELLIYDDVGNMEAPDSAPTIDVVNQAGNSRNANLDSTTMTLVSTGRYRSTYTIDTLHALEQLIFSFSITEGSATRTYANPSFVVDTTAVDFTATDRTHLDALYGKLPSKSYLTATDNSDGSLDATEISAVQSGLATGSGLTGVQTHGDANWSTATGFASPTNVTNAEANIESAIDTLQTHGDTDWATRSLVLGIEGDLQGNISDSQDAIIAHGDANWETTSSFDPTTDPVIVGTNNDKTGYSLNSDEKTAIEGGVWDQLSGSHILSGSFGLLFSQIIASIASLVGVRTIIASFLDRTGVISIDQDTDATIIWNSDDYPNLSGSTVTFIAEPTTKNTSAANISKSVAFSFADDTWALTLQFSNGDSTTYDTGTKVYRYKVMATLSGGDIVVLERGYLSVDKAIA